MEGKTFDKYLTEKNLENEMEVVIAAIARSKKTKMTEDELIKFARAYVKDIDDAETIAFQIIKNPKAVGLKNFKVI